MPQCYETGDEMTDMELDEYVQLSAEYDMEQISNRKRKRPTSQCSSYLDSLKKNLDKEFESSDLFDSPSSTKSSSGFPVTVQSAASPQLEEM